MARKTKAKSTAVKAEPPHAEWHETYEKDPNEGFYFGERSERELEGVHDDLISVALRALELSSIDFSVHDGLRDEAQQAEYVRTGASKTMDSRHLTGHAVDLVPYVNGKMRWEWPLCYQVAKAVRAAAEELNVPIVWGGCWTGLNGTVEEPRVLRARRKGWDGPHFELPRGYEA